MGVDSIEKLLRSGPFLFLKYSSSEPTPASGRGNMERVQLRYKKAGIDYGKRSSFLISLVARRFTVADLRRAQSSCACRMKTDGSKRYHKPNRSSLEHGTEAFFSLP